MPKKVFDEDGNEMEIPTEEEIQAKIKEEVEKAKAPTDKELNFAQLRAKIQKGEELSAKEKELFDKEQALAEKEKTFEQRTKDSWTKRSLMTVCGGDAEMMEKVRFVLENDLAGRADTEEEIAEKVRKAYILTKGHQPKIDPVASVMGIRGEAPTSTKKTDSFYDSDEGKSAAKSLWPNG